MRSIAINLSLVCALVCIPYVDDKPRPKSAWEQGRDNTHCTIGGIPATWIHASGDGKAIATESVSLSFDKSGRLISVTYEPSSAAVTQPGE